MAWIEAHDTLPDHPKVLRAAKALKLDSDALVGKLIRLWTWALGNREDGVLSDLDADRLSHLMNYGGKPERLLQALTENKLLDEEERGYRIHDWDEHVSMLMDKRERLREQARARKQRQRDKNRSQEQPGHAQVTRDQDATGHAGHAATVPYPTVPYPTVPTDDRIDDPAALQCARGGQGDEWDDLPWEERAEETLSHGFARWVGREPTLAEMQALAANTGAGGGMSPEMVLLALEKAQTYGASSPAGYACKVLAGWRRNGLFSPEAVDSWEAMRSGEGFGGAG